MFKHGGLWRETFTSWANTESPVSEAHAGVLETWGVSSIFTYPLGKNCSLQLWFPLQSPWNARNESWLCAWALRWFSPLTRLPYWQLPGEKLNESVSGTNCIRILCAKRSLGNRNWGFFFLFVIVWFSLNRNFHKIRFSKKQQALIHAVIRILTPGPNWLPKRSTACVNWLGSILAFWGPFCSHSNTHGATSGPVPNIFSCPGSLLQVSSTSWLSHGNGTHRETSQLREGGKGRARIWVKQGQGLSSNNIPNYTDKALASVGNWVHSVRLHTVGTLAFCPIPWCCSRR